MNRPKIFLALTTFCLAAAGIVAAKTARGHTDAWYYTAPGRTHCKAALATCQASSNGTVTCKTVSSGAKPYFTNFPCTVPLHYTQL